MKILAAASEIYPLVKTGGLADVVGALPGALRNHGVSVRTLVPAYPAVSKALAGGRPVHKYANLFGGPAAIIASKAHELDLLALDAPHLFNRPGNPYLASDGKDWPDNGERFAALGIAAADVAGGIIKDYQPDILHAHDWQAALAPVYLKFRGKGPPSLITIHNIAFQGQFPASIFASLRLPQKAFAIDGVEYFGKVGYLKGGLQCASAITTVSPTYAEEIRTPEFGMGLDGVLRARREYVTGIVNGIDTDVWNPASDANIATTYDGSSLAKRAINKREIEKRIGLARDDGILVCVVSRLTGQKGMDILASSTERIVGAGARLALIGKGEAEIEDDFAAAAKRHKGRVGAVFAYDERLAHLLQAGADAILIPSRFEPCGLTQLYGLRYGCVPIVSRTGGLSDTIIDANDAAVAAGVATGIQFAPVDAQSFENAIARALRLYAQPDSWRAMQQRGMKTDVSWKRSAAAYVDLYRNLKQL